MSVTPYILWSEIIVVPTSCSPCLFPSLAVLLFALWILLREGRPYINRVREMILARLHVHLSHGILLSLLSHSAWLPISSRHCCSCIPRGPPARPWPHRVQHLQGCSAPTPNPGLWRVSTAPSWEGGLSAPALPPQRHGVFANAWWSWPPHQKFPSMQPSVPAAEHLAKSIEKWV